MALYVSTIASLLGAVGINRIHRVAAQQDLGGKLERLISTINAINSAISTLTTVVSAHNTAFVSAANSGISFSAFSTSPSATIAVSLGTVSNFNVSRY
jgi:hypothetical protein